LGYIFLREKDKKGEEKVEKTLGGKHSFIKCTQV